MKGAALAVEDVGASEPAPAAVSEARALLCLGPLAAGLASAACGAWEAGE